jgi:molybdopterin-synthase adenylyltransferase
LNRSAASFSYAEAFSRNIGWVTRAEQETLRETKVAIAGMGGVGGIHLITLARLGVGRFSLADFDAFDVANFNRQAGALVSTLGMPKLDVMCASARDINPEMAISAFPQGINESNVAQFLDGVSVYIDGLDFFAFAARKMLYAELARRSIPAVVAAPLGMGVAVINFLPGQMQFEEFFDLKDHSEEVQALHFLVGLSPAMLQRTYLVDRSAVDLRNRKGPSTAMSCQLCAGFAATEALKIVLKRGRVLGAPWGLHFDPYRYKFKRTWRPWGNRNPIQKLAIAIARRQIAAGR